MASDPGPTRPLAQALVADLRDARARTLELVRDLSGERLLGPRLDIVNPPLWEIGHVAWFHEHFILCGLDERAPIRPDADALYDSARVAHDRRWDLPLPELEDTLAYMQAVQDALVARLERRSPSAEEAYRYRLTTYHEDMHGEAFAYTRQTLGYPAPSLAAAEVTQDFGQGALAGDAAVPGGTFLLGATREETFVFDNEKWAHAVEIAPFRIARAPVTQVEYLAFVEDGGYRRRELWSAEGWRWRESANAEHPAYWSKTGNRRWQLRSFDRSVPLAPQQPVIHVNWFEADAWCRWAGRRLPTEAEWEAAAAGEPSDDGRRLAPRKRRYPWGDESPAPKHANVDGCRIGCVDVAAHAAGDSAFGCRQMLGNVWEWTASAFVPYPGFAPDVYAEYSQPWFGTHKVLRGGCWATRGRMINASYRNFFTPERRDLFAGFRTCAL